jgi:hypothetical protein
VHVGNEDRAHADPEVEIACQSVPWSIQHGGEQKGFAFQTYDSRRIGRFGGKSRQFGNSRASGEATLLPNWPSIGRTRRLDSSEPMGCLDGDHWVFASHR